MFSCCSAILGTAETLGKGAVIPETGVELPLRLEVVPNYIDLNTYTMTGRVMIDEGEAVPFGGEVSGGDTQLYVLTSPTLPSSFEAQFNCRGELWEIVGAQVNEEARRHSSVAWYVSFALALNGYNEGIY